mgnify:CR=1 FL=1
MGLALYKNRKILTGTNGGAKEIIYNYNIGGKLLEDYVSKRGIINRYNELSKAGYLYSPKDIASQNNEYSIQTYSEMGEKLGKSISKLLHKYSIEIVIFGGQISKSLKLFKNSFLKEMSNIKVIEAIDIDNSALIGAMF